MSCLLNPPTQVFGTANLIVSGANRHYQATYAGPLSLKWTQSGTGTWDCSNRRNVVSPDRFLLVDRQQPYTIEINSAERVRTFCLFFADGFVEQAYRCLTNPETALDGDRPGDVEMHGLIPERDPQVIAELGRMHAAMKDRDRTAGWFEDRFFSVAGLLCRLRVESEGRCSRLPAVRESTRRELLKRLERARDVLASGRGCDLASAAREACLSPFHLHRLFRQAYGETPHQYVTRLRMTRAVALLERSQWPIETIAAECGFSSVSAFVHRFRAFAGNTPGAFRKIRKPQIRKNEQFGPAFSD